MADEFTSRHRARLVKLLHAAQSKTSAISLIAELQRQKDKFPKKSLHSILLDVAKTDKSAEQAFKEIHVNLNSEISALECLQRFLEAYEKLRYARKLNNRNNIETITEDEENSMLQRKPPSLDDHKKTAAPTTVGTESIQNNNTISNSTDGARIHSQLFFSKNIINSLPLQINPPNCEARSTNEQERILIEDLLHCFIGILGDFITPQNTEKDQKGPANYSFIISDQINISLRSIVLDLLPMATHYSMIQEFVQWSDKLQNQVLLALSEVLQTILNDYRLSIIQLEKENINNNLNLHKLHYIICPSAEKLHILSELVGKIARSNLNSGTILSILYDEITLQTADQILQKMLIEITERAAVPYIKTLERWILKGVIIDPYKQFFIYDHGLSIQNSQMDEALYWESRYTIQFDCIPRFLENDADIILRTGKYLNVIRQCGKEITIPSNELKLYFSASNHSDHSTFIKQAYQNASKTLLDLLMNELNLMGHITSVKRYFLLQQGDLITQFMDASEKELSKTVDKVFPLNLNNLLQLIVRLSSAKHDPCIEHLFCDLFTMDLMEQVSKIHEADHQQMSHIDIISHEKFSLSGLECFAFGYSVEWPVSIVLNQWATTHYQMLFRLLFYCKHVERQLCKAWIETCVVCKRMPNEQKTQWRIAFALCQRMLNAIIKIQNYWMIEVIEPTWHIFTERVKTVQSVDEVITIHQDFLHTCSQNCLNHPDILRAVMNMSGVCLKFSKFIQGDITTNVSLKWQTFINSFGQEFDKFLFQLLNNINAMTSDQPNGAKLVNLVHGINFNNYYSDSIEQNAMKTSS